MNYFRKIRDRNNELLRLRDIITNDNANSDFIEFIDLISDNRYLKFIQIFQDKAYQLLETKKGSAVIVNIGIYDELSKYLNNNGVVNHFEENGVLSLYNHSKSEKYKDIIVNIAFNPSFNAINADYFKRINEKYFRNINVDCYVKRNGEYLKDCNGYYSDFKDRLETTDEIFIRELKI